MVTTTVVCNRYTKTTRHKAITKRWWYGLVCHHSQVVYIIYKIKATQVDLKKTCTVYKWVTQKFLTPQTKISYLTNKAQLLKRVEFYYCG